MNDIEAQAEQIIDLSKQAVKAIEAGAITMESIPLAPIRKALIDVVFSGKTPLSKLTKRFKGDTSLNHRNQPLRDALRVTTQNDLITILEFIRFLGWRLKIGIEGEGPLKEAPEILEELRERLSQFDCFDDLKGE